MLAAAREHREASSVDFARHRKRERRAQTRSGAATTSRPKSSIRKPAVALARSSTFVRAQFEFFAAFCTPHAARPGPRASASMLILGPSTASRGSRCCAAAWGWARPARRAAARRRPATSQPPPAVQAMRRHHARPANLAPSIAPVCSHAWMHHRPARTHTISRRA